MSVVQQPYNPNAERDARIEAEGLYTDPIDHFTTFDEDDPRSNRLHPISICKQVAAVYLLNPILYS